MTVNHEDPMGSRAQLARHLIDVHGWSVHFRGWSLAELQALHRAEHPARRTLSRRPGPTNRQPRSDPPEAA
jgi:hypothetical protein